jgi:hypothetical protein
VHPDPVLALLSKIGTISAAGWIAIWIVQYTYYTKGKAWKNHIGASLMCMKMLIGIIMLLIALESFFTWGTSVRTALTWVNVILVLLFTPCMIWRVWAWWTERSTPE